MRAAVVIVLAGCGYFDKPPVHHAPDGGRLGDTLPARDGLGDGLAADAPAGDGAADGAGPLVVTIPAAADTYVTNVTQQQRRQNFGGETIVRAGLVDRNALLRFDLSALPPSTVVLSGEVHLVTADESSGAQLDRMLEAWDEGTAAGTSGFCDWDDRQANVVWTTPGGLRYGSQDDVSLGLFAASPLGTPTVSPLAQAGVAVVQGWIANPASNFGFAFITTGTHFSFYSREAADPAVRPTLVLTLQR